MSLSHHSALSITVCILVTGAVGSGAANDPAPTNDAEQADSIESTLPDTDDNDSSDDDTNGDDAKEDGTNDDEANDSQPPPIPEDLLEDADLLITHGIREASAPSIRKLFTDCASGPGVLPYNDLRRDPMPRPAQDRTLLAMHMGALIADGFLVVRSNRLRDIEPVGTAILEHAEILGTGRHIKAHAKSLLEFAAAGEVDKLKEELAVTQIDVEKEMIDLRDPEIAFLFSLGGWVRSFEIGCVTIMQDFKEADVRKLARTDVLDFYIYRLENMPDRLRERKPIQDIRTTLDELAIAIDQPEDQPFTPSNLANMRRLAAELMAIISSSS